jgi:DNA-binding beta-propeller fold protein YncE
MDRREFLVAAAALALARPRIRHVLVTADLESHIVVVDALSGVVVRHIPTHAYPRSIETVGDAAVVCHSEVGLVSVIRRLRVQHVLDGFGEPRYTAAHPDGRHAYITDAKRGDVALVDTLSGRLLAREPVGPLARHITIDGGARRLWVALGSKAREVAVLQLDGVRPKLVRRFAPPALSHDVGFAPDGVHAWVSAGEGRELAVYDLGTGRVVARPSAGWPPQHVTFSATRAFVTSGWSGRLQLHTLDGRELRSAPVPVGSYNVQQADGIVVTPALGYGWLTTISLAGHVERTQKVARSSHDACIV